MIRTGYLTFFKMSIDKVRFFAYNICAVAVRRVSRLQCSIFSK